MKYILGRLDHKLTVIKTDLDKEPDHSFAFGTDKSLPDLAVEVTYTSGSIADLEKYKYLGVKEIWFWQNRQITFYSLVNGEYETVESSICLPQLDSDFLIPFINRGLTETPLTIEADFYQQLNNSQVADSK